MLVEAVPYCRAAMGRRALWDKSARILDISVLLTGFYIECSIRGQKKECWASFRNLILKPCHFYFVLLFACLGHLSLLRDTCRDLGFPLIPYLDDLVEGTCHFICTYFSHVFQPTIWRIIFVSVVEVVILMISTSCSRLHRHNRSV